MGRGGGIHTGDQGKKITDYNIYLYVKSEAKMLPLIFALFLCYKEAIDIRYNGIWKNDDHIQLLQNYKASYRGICLNNLIEVKYNC